MVYDVVVVGLGPAGCSALKTLEGTNLKVLALERTPSFPRKKPCAGGLTPKAYGLLKELFPNLDAVVRKRVSQFLLYNGKDYAVLSSNAVLTYLTNREELDSFLFKSLDHSQFEVHIGETALSVEIEKDRVVLKTDKGIYESKIVLVASGVNSRIARQLKVKREIGFTYESYVESNRENLIIDFTGFSWGYYWAFPKGETVTTGLGEFRSKKIFSSLRELLYEFNRKHEFRGKELWSSGFPIPAGKRVNDVYRSRVLFLGDAGGLVDPLTGEGIYYAAKSGVIAAEKVKQFFLTGNEGSLRSYQSAINSQFGEEFFWARIVGKCFFSFKGVNFSIVRRSQRISQLAAELLSGNLSYRDSFFNYLKLLPGALLRR